MTERTHTYRQLVQDIERTDLQFDESRLREAWDTALDAYSDSLYSTGESVLDHVLGVLHVLLPFQPDEDAIVACLLQQVLHCKYWTLAELEEHFGPTVRELVSGVHLLSHITLRDRRASVEDLRLMLLTVSDDIRIILIALCDRCHLLESLSQKATPDRKRIAQESLQLFAPVAARLGIYNLKNTLESQSFPVVYPSDEERLKQQLLQVQQMHGDVLGRVCESLQVFFADHGMTVHISSRKKQLFSIFRKMREKSLTHLLDLYDLFAVRVVVESEADCYRALGLLHQLGKPVPNRFKDYIAFPKPNGYQSLHTTLIHLPGIADESLRIEAQIRTESMHREAEFGIAAHWMYKEDARTERAVKAVELHTVLASQQSLTDDILADHIYVLTPHGDIIELPAGATPLDLAFQIHTDLGLAFKGARVNGSMVPIDHHLENGDIVEILRHSSPNPSPQWMQLLKMSSSRARLKKYLYAQDRPRYIADGRLELNKELRKQKHVVLDSDLSILRFYDGEVLNMRQREDILMKIGQGAERATTVLQHLDAIKEKDITPAPKRTSRVRSNIVDSTIAIEDDIAMPIARAKCCKPVRKTSPKIVGVIARGGVVKVHNADCRLVQNANPDRLVSVLWEVDR